MSSQSTRLRRAVKRHTAQLLNWRQQTQWIEKQLRPLQEHPALSDLHTQALRLDVRVGDAHQELTAVLDAQPRHTRSVRSGLRSATA